MTVKKILLFVLIVFCFSFIGCSKAPIYNATNISAPMGTTEESMRDTILKAGKELDWRMVQIRPDCIEGTYTFKNKHTAVVNITYTKSAYSIIYSRSTDLKEGNGKIHKAYNTWVKKLSERINLLLGSGK